jgi:GT2 family glycosyltransferase
MRLSIVFVRFGLREMENEVLAHTIRETQERDLTIRIVDNWGNPESLTALWNRVCMEEVESGTDVLCLLNSDCWVGPGWWPAIVRVFRTRPDVAVCGPHSNCGPQTAPSELQQATTDGWRVRGLERASERCRELWRGRERECEIYGHCFCLRAADFAAAHGFFPELQQGYTLYGSEQSLSRRLRALNRKVVCAMDAYAFHLGQASGRLLPAGTLAAELARGQQLYRR